MKMFLSNFINMCIILMIFVVFVNSRIKISAIVVILCNFKNYLQLLRGPFSMKLLIDYWLILTRFPFKDIDIVFFFFKKSIICKPYSQSPSSSLLSLIPSLSIKSTKLIISIEHMPLLFSPSTGRHWMKQLQL